MILWGYYSRGVLWFVEGQKGTSEIIKLTHILEVRLENINIFLTEKTTYVKVCCVREQSMLV